METDKKQDGPEALGEGYGMGTGARDSIFTQDFKMSQDCELVHKPRGGHSRQQV